MNIKLEVISEKQRDISNHLLISACEQACDEHSLSPENRTNRIDLTTDLRTKLIGSQPLNYTLEELVALWRSEEHLWHEALKDEIKTDVPVDWLTYRVLVLFARNYMLCPFSITQKNLFGKPTKVPDSSFFEATVARQFQNFCRKLESIVVSQPGFEEFKKALSLLKKEDLDDNLHSARYRLANKDMSILKGTLIGGGVGVLTTLTLGPLIGGFIGEFAGGLTGAAATSYGLAVLGGGTIASGGFGMAGGSLFLGVFFAGWGSKRQLESQSERDLQELCQAMKNLPILLSTGRLLKKLGMGDLHKTINKKITERARESEDRETELMQSESEKEHLKQASATRTLYESAKDLSKTYDWVSGYDVFNKSKGIIRRAIG